MKLPVAAPGALLALALPALSRIDPAPKAAPPDGFAALSGGLQPITSREPRR